MALSFLILAMIVAVPASAQTPTEALTPGAFDRGVEPRAAGCDSTVQVTVSAENRDLLVASDSGKEELFASFGAAAHTVRRVHDARGDESFGESKPQADEAACATPVAWLYRFAYVSRSPRGGEMPAFASTISTSSTVSTTLEPTPAPTQ